MNWKPIALLGGIIFIVILIVNLMSDHEFVPKKFVPNKDDVVLKMKEEKNIDRFYQFLDDVKNKKSSSVRIVHYTIEGDPIIQGLIYDGNKIKHTHDNSRDSFGGSDIGITETTYDEIVMNEKIIDGKVYQEYSLKKNGKDDMYLLSLQKE